MPRVVTLEALTTKVDRAADSCPSALCGFRRVLQCQPVGIRELNLSASVQLFFSEFNLLFSFFALPSVSIRFFSSEA